jgi:glyoxylase I family protein
LDNKQALIQNRLIGVMYYSLDLEASSRWYCDNLGFQLGAYDYSDFVELVLDGRYMMHLFRSDVAGFRPVERATFVLGTEDIEHVHRHLSTRINIVESIKRYGDHAGFSFRDPDGNALTICQYD